MQQRHKTVFVYTSTKDAFAVSWLKDSIS